MERLARFQHTSCQCTILGFSLSAGASTGRAAARLSEPVSPARRGADKLSSRFARPARAGLQPSVDVHPALQLFDPLLAGFFELLAVRALGELVARFGERRDVRRVAFDDREDDDRILEAERFGDFT